MFYLFHHTTKNTITNRFRFHKEVFYLFHHKTKNANRFRFQRIVLLIPQAIVRNCRMTGVIREEM